MAMHHPVYNDIDWIPINATSSKEMPGYYSRLSDFNYTTMDVSNYYPLSDPIYSNTYNDNLIGPSDDQLSSRTIENELEILNLDGLMAFVGPNNVVEMTVTSMASNIIVALGWIILGTFYLGAKLLAGADSQISLFADILGPQAVGGNVMRCLVGFGFTLVGIIGKTMLTVGMHDTMHQFLDKDMDEYWGMVSNDKFLKDSLIRAILSTMFLVLGWSIIGIVAKSALFSSTDVLSEISEFNIFGRKKKRRRRQTRNREFVSSSINPFSHIERNFPSLTLKNPGFNEYLIKRSYKNLLRTQEPIS